MEFKQALLHGFKKMNLVLQPEEAALFYAYYERLKALEGKLNLTGLKEPEEIAIKHFVDSLAATRWLTFRAGERLIDIGSGAGFPGVPLAVSAPGLAVVLLEAARKKADFLNELIAALSLKNVKVVCGRAEEYGHAADYRERFDWVVARAVAPLRELVEYAVPFVRPGGAFVAYKGARGSKEAEAALYAIRLLGATIEKVVEYSLPRSGEQRLLIFMRKTAPTPPSFPRRAGMPHKKPL
jgi:16S rRNA (guanine527-N7)-methyltransferase